MNKNKSTLAISYERGLQALLHPRPELDPVRRCIAQFPPPHFSAWLLAGSNGFRWRVGDAVFVESAGPHPLFL